MMLWPSSALDQPLPHKQKGPVCDRAFLILAWSEALRRFVCDLFLGRLVGGLGTAARALGERRLDLLDRLGLGAALHRRDLSAEPVERCFVKLTLRIALLRLRVGAEQVAHDLRDRHDVARVDLGFVFLGAARPHGALDARATFERLERAPHQPALGELAHPDGRDLADRHAQRHLVLDEVDDEQLELVARYLLLLARQDLADAVSRVHDVLVDLEPVTLRRLGDGPLHHRHDGALGAGGGGTSCSLLGSHTSGCSLSVRLANRLLFGAAGGTRRDPPAATGGGLFAVTLLQTTRFLSHCFRVELTLPDPVSRLSSRKNKLPTGSAFGFWLIVSLIYHISPENQGLGAMQTGKAALFGQLFCRNR